MITFYVSNMVLDDGQAATKVGNRFLNQKTALDGVYIRQQRCL